MIFRDPEFGQAMNGPSARYTWTTKWVLAACFFALTAPAPAEGPALTVPSSEFGGKVFGTDGQPAVGIEILTYHLATAELFTGTTDAKGAFTLAALPYGYFDLAARSAEGLYVADQVANVSPTGKNVVKLRLQAFSPSIQADRRAFPGADEIPIGVAVVINQGKIESFWRGPRGVSLLGGGGVLALLAFGGGSSEPVSSPFVPGG